MHARVHKQSKLSRMAGSRRAVLRGLLDSLILYERVETTEAKAKELKRLFDPLVTKAKKDDLHNYRQIVAKVINPVAAQKLQYDLVNGFKSRNSGYTRIVKTGNRRGDSSPMAIVELVLDDGYQTGKAEGKSKKAGVKKPEAKKLAKPKSSNKDPKSKPKEAKKRSASKRSEVV